MSTHKICVYAICKNEMKFVDRWLTSLHKESDYIVVLDTGSTDGTFEYLQNDPRVYKCEQKIFDPWRFDTARNYSMSLIPEDTTICVVSDLDQTFREGWSESLKREFNNGFNCVAGPIIDYDDDNNEIKRFLSYNVHSNDRSWRWERPVHEGLKTDGEERLATVEDFVIEHHPDYTKSRGGYLDILRREYEENHSDPMCAIYYGCELEFRGFPDESFEVFKRAIGECDYTGQESVGCQTYLNLARCYLSRGNNETAYFIAFAAQDFGVPTRRLYMTLFECCSSPITQEYWLKRALAYTYYDKSWIEDDIYFKGLVELELFRLYHRTGNEDGMKSIGKTAMNLLKENGFIDDYEYIKNTLEL